MLFPLFPQNRHCELLRAWWTIHVTHADLAGYWQDYRRHTGTRAWSDTCSCFQQKYTAPNAWKLASCPNHFPGD